MQPTEFGPTSESSLVRRIRGSITAEGVLLPFGGLIVVGSIVLAVVGPWIAPFDPEVPTGVVSQAPGPVHWFGTDAAGLDIFSRVIAAPRIDLTIALSVVAVGLVVGGSLGLLTGYFDSRVSNLIVRISDLVQSFPVFILAMIFVTVAGRKTSNIVVTLGLLYTPIFLRLTRSKALSESRRSYVESARSLGLRETVIAIRHVLPNSLGPALTQSSVTIGWAILLTAGLSFIGAGVRPPAAEWGVMIAGGAQLLILGEWWPSVFPGMAISVTVFGYAIVGNVLQQRYG